MRTAATSASVRPGEGVLGERGRQSDPGPLADPKPEPGTARRRAAGHDGRGAVNNWSCGRAGTGARLVLVLALETATRPSTSAGTATIPLPQLLPQLQRPPPRPPDPRHQRQHRPHAQHDPHADAHRRWSRQHRTCILLSRLSSPIGPDAEGDRFQNLFSYGLRAAAVSPPPGVDYMTRPVLWSWQQLGRSSWPA
jgi:hypothetical protein